MSNAVIGALRVNLGIDTAAFSNGLKSAGTSAERFSKVAKTALAAVGVAAAGMATALAAGVRNALNEADNLAKMSAKIGIPIEELSKLKYAADLSGISLDGLATGVGKLSRTMVEAAGGTGEGAKAFKALGINVKGSDGALKSSTQIITEMADKFAAMPDGATKTALAMQLMGRSGASMIPLLNGGSSALTALLDEAKAFGLEISASTGKAAEQFNDNLSRIGYAAQGVTIGLTAALAPALAVVSDALVGMAQGFVDALTYLPQVAEYAAVAGGALALMFSPAILAAAGSLAVAIGTGLVGAIRAVTAAMAANPLGAIAVGVTIAVTAIYHFRDEIQKAIGVDVVGIVRDGANGIIGSFVAAFEHVKFVWNNFPNIIGAAVIGAANLVVEAVNMMINDAKKAVNGLIAAMNLIPGVDIAAMDTSSGAIKSLPNTFLSAMDQAVVDRNAGISEALNRDYIGEIGKAFSGATPAAQNFAGAVGGVNDALDALGGGAGGKGKGKKGDGGAAKRAAAEIARMAEAMERAKETLGSGFGSIIDGLINKTMTWKDALIDAGRAILRYFDQTNIAKGGKGLFGGGLLQGLLGSLLGFRANGGPVSAGMPYIVGERGPELMIPGKSGTVVANRDLKARSTHVTVGVAADGNGNLMPFVQSVAQREASAAAGQVARAVPAMVDARQKAVSIGRGRA